MVLDRTHNKFETSVSRIVLYNFCSSLPLGSLLTESVSTELDHKLCSPVLYYSERAPYRVQPAFPDALVALQLRLYDTCSNLITAS